MAKRLVSGARGLTAALAWTGAGCLGAWTVSVTGTTGWSPTTNWTLFGAGLALLVLRALA